MIFVCPHNADWNQIADLTGDASWRAERMRDYFERIERCEHRAARRRAGQAGHEPEPPRLVGVAPDGNRGPTVAAFRTTISAHDHPRVGARGPEPARRWP